MAMQSILSRQLREPQEAYRRLLGGDGAIRKTTIHKRLQPQKQVGEENDSSHKKKEYCESSAFKRQSCNYKESRLFCSLVTGVQ